MTEHGFGKIYADFNKCRFRIIRNSINFSTERQRTWEGKKPTEAEWKSAKQLVEKWWAGEP